MESGASREAPIRQRGAQAQALAEPGAAAQPAVSGQGGGETQRRRPGGELGEVDP